MKTHPTKRTFLTCLLVFAWCVCANAQIDNTREALRKHFEAAKVAAVKGNRALAKASVEKAEALVRRVQSSAQEPDAARLNQAADRLQTIGGEIQSGDASVSVIAKTFAYTHAALARHYLHEAERAADASKRTRAGQMLIKAGDHVETSFKWAGRKLEKGRDATVELLQDTGERMKSGAETEMAKLRGAVRRGKDRISQFTRTKLGSRTGIIFGEDHVFQLTAPEGWLLDTECGLTQGLVAVFYPQGHTWASSEVFSYTGTVPHQGSTETIKGAAQSFVDHYRKDGHADYHSTLGQAIPLSDGREAAVYRFEGDDFGNYEIAAFIEEQKTINFVVMAGLGKEAFEEALPAFRQLVTSYVYIADHPDKAQEQLSYVWGDQWKQQLTKQVREPVRHRRKSRRHK